MNQIAATRHICKSIITSMLVSSNYTSKCKELRRFLFMNFIFIFFCSLESQHGEISYVIFITIISKIKGVYLDVDH